MGTLIDLTGGANDPPRTVANANIPAMMRLAKWRFRWVADAASSTKPAFIQWVTWSTDDNACIYYDKAATSIKIGDTTGATVATIGGVTWSASDVIIFELDPIAMTLTLSGTGSGNSAISGTLAGFWPSANDMRIGDGYAGPGTFATGGTYGDIENDYPAAHRRSRALDYADPDASVLRRLMPIAAFGVAPALSLIPSRLRAAREDERATDPALRRRALPIAAIPAPPVPLPPLRDRGVLPDEPPPPPPPLRLRTMPIAAFGVPPVPLPPLRSRVALRDEAAAATLEPPARRVSALAALLYELPPASSGARRPRDRQRGRDRWRGR